MDVVRVTESADADLISLPLLSSSPRHNQFKGWRRRRRRQVAGAFRHAPRYHIEITKKKIQGRLSTVCL